MTTIPAAIFDLSLSKSGHTVFHPLASLLDWSDRQSESRILWSAVAITSLGCVFAPIATIAVSLSGLNVAFTIVVMLAMSVSLIANLAAQPTRITIPLYFLSVLINLIIIGSALVKGCHFSNIFTPY